MTVQLDVGEWGLFCGSHGKQVVRVGDEPCGPVSARKITRAIPRKLLLDEPRVERAFENNSVPETGTVTYDDHDWTIAFRPVVSPRTSMLVGLLAGVWPASEPLPEPPLVGSWEWEIERDSAGHPTAHRRTFWDRNLFQLYDVSPDTTERRAGYWEVGVWASELIARSDQMRLTTSVREGIRDGPQGLRCLTFNVATGYGTANRGNRHLRLVGRVVTPRSEDSKIVLRGFSYQVPETFQDMAFEQDAARVDDVLRGVMDLTDEPMAVLDPDTLEVLLTSPVWRRQDFGHIGAFGDVLAEDPDRVREYIAQALTGRTGARPSLEVQLRRSDGSSHPVRMTIASVRAGDREGDDALIKLVDL